MKPTATNGASMPISTTREHKLPGDVTATVVTIEDADGTTTATQITAPDEPMTSDELFALAGELAMLATALNAPEVTS